MHHRFPLVERDVRDRLAEADPCTVDECTHGAELGLDGLDQLFETAGGCEVELEVSGRVAGPVEPIGNASACRGIDIDHRYRTSGCGDHVAYAGSNAESAAPGHNNNATKPPRGPAHRLPDYR